MLHARDAGLDDEDDGGSSGNSSIPARSGKFTHTVLGDGSVVSTVVDATDYEEWQKLDLDTGYADNDDWDLAFRRFVVLSNGGVSGDGGVQMLKLKDVDFEDVTEAPGAEAGWSVDQPDGKVDEDEVADNLFNNGTDDWYDYELSTHGLTPKDVVFLIRSTQGRFFKLRIEDYYDDVGTSGFLSFRWGEIDGPDEELPPQEVPNQPGGPDDPDDPDDPDPEVPDDVFTVDASSYDTWTYVKLTDGVVTIANPSTSTDWDIAVQRYVFRTNSGTSGPGVGGAKLDTSGIAYDELASIDPGDFVIDAILPASGAPGSVEGTGNSVLEIWYDYFGLGNLKPKEETYLVRTGVGTYGKLRIFSYSGGIFQMSFLPVTASSP